MIEVLEAHFVFIFGAQKFTFDGLEILSLCHDFMYHLRRSITSGADKLLDRVVRRKIIVLNKLFLFLLSWLHCLHAHFWFQVYYWLDLHNRILERSMIDVIVL